MTNIMKRRRRRSNRARKKYRVLWKKAGREYEGRGRKTLVEIGGDERGAVGEGEEGGEGGGEEEGEGE